MDPTTIEIFAILPPDFLEMLAGVLFCVLVGKFTKAETRVLMAAVAGVVVYPHAAALFGVGLMAIFYKVFDFFSATHEGG